MSEKSIVKTGPAALTGMIGVSVEAAKDAGRIVGGQLLFAMGKKSSVDFIAKMSDDPVGKLMLACLASCSAGVVGDPILRTFADSMNVAALDNALGTLLDKGLALIKTTDPMPPDAASVREFIAEQAAKDKDTRFSATIGEGVGAPEAGKSSGGTDYWPTKQSEAQEKNGKLLCPLCNVLVKRKNMSLFKADPEKPEVLCCTNCQTKIKAEAKKKAEEQAKIEAVKAEENRLKEIKAEITSLEGQMEKAEKEASSTDALYKANPESAVFKAAKLAGDATIEELNTRYSALVDEAAGLEAKFSGKATPAASAAKPAAPVGKTGVLGNLAAAEAKAKSGK